MARPTTPIAVLEAVLARVQQGCPIKAACAAEGMNFQTWYRTRDRAERLAVKKRKTLADKAVIDWAERAELATDAAEAFWFDRFVEEAALPRGKGNWLPAWKVLGARFGHNWAERRTVDIPVETEAETEFDLERLTRAELKELRALVKKAREGADDGERRLRAV